MIFSNNIYNQIDHVGLSISPDTVRVIGTDKTGKINQQFEIHNPQPFIVGDVVDGLSLTKILVELKNHIGINSPYAAVSIPEKLAFSREHVLPKISTPEIAEAISWQVVTIFPLNPDDIYYDWKLIAASDQETRVVVTAVSKKLLDGILKSCQDAGIKPISFESSASVLARAINTLPPEAIITEIDSSGSSSTLVENGVSSLTATTNFRIEAGSEAVIGDIVLSINQLLSRIQPNSADNAVPRIYITGEKSSTKLAEILSNQIGQKVAELSMDQVPANYHIAYVESRTNVESPESEKTINLLPENLQQIYREEAELAHAKKTTLIGSLITGISCLVAIGVYLTVSLIYQQSTGKLATIAEPPNTPTEINVPLIMQKAQKISTLQTAKKIPTTTIAEAINLTQTPMLRQFDYAASTKTLKISLIGIGREALFNLKDLFEKSGKFQPIAIPLSALGSEKAEAVSLTIQFK